MHDQIEASRRDAAVDQFCYLYNSIKYTTHIFNLVSLTFVSHAAHTHLDDHRNTQYKYLQQLIFLYNTDIMG